MHRRSLIQSLLAGPLALVGVRAVVDTPPATPMWTHVAVSRDRGYRGYDLSWTGWKAQPDSYMLVGQWIATRRDLLLAGDMSIPGASLYVNVPGFIGGYYHPWNVFNLTTRYERVCTPQTSDAQAQAWLTQGLGYITQLVDRAIDHGFANCPSYYSFPVVDWPALDPQPEYSFGFTGFKP